MKMYVKTITLILEKIPWFFREFMAIYMTVDSLNFNLYQGDV